MSRAEHRLQHLVGRLDGPAHGGQLDPLQQGLAAVLGVHGGQQLVADLGQRGGVQQQRAGGHQLSGGERRRQHRAQAVDGNASLLGEAGQVRAAAAGGGEHHAREAQRDRPARRGARGPRAARAP